MRCVIFTGRMPRSGKLPVLNLLRGQKWGFPPHRSNSLHQFTSNSMADGHLCPLGCAKFHLNRHRGGGWECGPKISQISTFGKESPFRGKPFDRFLQFLKAFIRSTIRVLILTWFASEVTGLLLRNRTSVIYAEIFRAPCWKKLCVGSKMIGTFFDGSTSSITMQSLGKIV